MPQCNADIESVHSTSESEFYEAEFFIIGDDFRQKAWTYQFWCNVKRKNSSRNWLAPIDIEKLDDLFSHIDPNVLFDSVDLSEELSYENLQAHLESLSKKNNFQTSFIGDALPVYKTHAIINEVQPSDR